jgi:Lon protease-like protein
MTGSGGDKGADTERLAAVPLFPLPNTVFFPNTLLPLHVFEPRYRQMTEHAIEGDGMIVIANARPEQGSGALADLHPIGGLGRIVHHERLADGRFHILMQGIARVRLCEQLPTDGLLYRRARLSVVDSVIADAEALAEELNTLRSCYAQVRNCCASEHLGDLCERVTDPGVLADVVCSSVLDDPASRQAALEEGCVVSRLKRANDALAGVLLGSMGKGSPVH